jgi:hypothetical protein
VKPVNGSHRTVLVVEPQRLVRQALVAAIDAAPGLAALDAVASGARAREGIDAAVIAADPWAMAGSACSRPRPTPVVRWC